MQVDFYFKKDHKQNIIPQDYGQNTCCSHPRNGEIIIDAANRRLMQEMGMSANLKHMFSFIYRAEFDNGLIEHEFDHVFIGKSNSDPVINSDEVCEWKWTEIKKIKKDIIENSHHYTEWFKIIFNKFFNKLI